jgi:Lrp/AsnC family transcriptional regulator for asnA, asnC and gidA
MDSLDHIDKHILQLLEKDGRIAFSTIAQQLGVSNTMIHQRVEKLQAKGIIPEFKPRFDEKALGFGLASYTGIVLDKDPQTERVIAELKKISEVTECYYIAGEFTLFVKIIARDTDHLREVLYKKVDAIEGVQRTESMIELGCAFKRNVSIE